MRKYEPDINDDDLEWTQDSKQRVLFIGDSLMCGIGASEGAGDALPKQIANSLSRRLQSKVSWISYGLDGGSVKMIRRELLPSIAAEMRRTMTEEGPLTAIVIMCGLNDFKRIAESGHSSSDFRREVRGLIEDLMKLAGPEGAKVPVFLPSTPVEHAPLFKGFSAFPAATVVCYLADLFDEQKRLIGEQLRNVHFLRPSSDSEDVLTSQHFGRDGLHPSALGYRVYGTALATQMFERIPASNEKVDPCTTIG